MGFFFCPSYISTVTFKINVIHVAHFKKNAHALKCTFRMSQTTYISEMHVHVIKIRIFGECT